MTTEATIELPCLGRPFGLGMLYDCRSDGLIPGVTLWDAKMLKGALRARPQQTSEYEVIAEDSIAAKSSSLGVEASLKASFLGGLVSVSGSATYMKDTKSSNYTARVSLKYNSTTRFEELSMDALGNIGYQPDNMATHVVTGVLYGADAFFVFDEQLSNDKDYTKVHGNLKVKVGGLPGIAIGGHGDVRVNEDDKQKAHKIHCKFYGDMILPRNPTTFDGAVEVYKDLPRLILDEKREVAKKVWLYPLSKLNGKVSRIMRYISMGLLNDVERLIEGLHQLEMQSNDICKNKVEVAAVFAIDTQISNFREMIAIYREITSEHLGHLLPKVRGGGAEESELAQLLENDKKSPMSYAVNSVDHFQRGWLRKKNEEVTYLGAFMQHFQPGCLKGVFFGASADDLIPYLYGAKHKHVLCFAFNIVSSYDTHLQDMHAYVHKKPKPTTGDSKGQLWYKDRRLMEEIQECIVKFQRFARPIEDRDDVKLVVVGCLETSSGGKEGHPAVVLFTDGKQVPLESIPEQNPFDSGKPIAFRCLSYDNDPNRQYLDGYIAEGKLILSPNTTGGYSGTHWKPEKLEDGSYAFRCLSYDNDPNRQYLDGRISEGRPILSPATTGGYSGTHWKPEKLEDGSYAFRCLSYDYNPKHIYLDGYIAEAKAILSPKTTGDYSGTHWKIEYPRD